ncbi:hypothetical protein QBC35DRAFT_518173 [Podospora australis]|uniref:Dihydroorotate dehydrogenase catalytic domain-containing protein n=1 Tax=Podospora australis TaxID=1536484 RepID=A0AAN7AF14_9PEZI|nr:hypothetical protein QBC35DRAFT_518173 [Podospora australis]
MGPSVMVNSLHRLRYPRRTNSTNSSSESATTKAAPTSQPPPPPFPKDSIWMKLGPLSKAVLAYSRAANRRPYVTQFCTSIVIFGVGDLGAQAIGGKDYEAIRTARSIAIGSSISIPVYLWFQYLATSFNYPSKIVSIATRVAVNQAVFTPLNNTWFFGMQKLLAGGTPEEVGEHIANTVPRTWYNAFKVWPAVMALNFAFVPRQFIPVVSGSVAMCWQVYLSYLNKKITGQERSLQGFVDALPPLARQQSLRLSTPSTVPRRPASTSSTPPSSGFSRAKTIVLGTSALLIGFGGYYYATDTRASFHRFLVPPLLRVIFPDAEDAHHAGTAALKTMYSLGLHPRERLSDVDPVTGRNPLSINVFGVELSNPIGISAGLDKDAEIPDPLFALGAGVVEVGGCTPFPQEGNPKPRVFRVPAVDGLVNRYGLNSRGADAMAARLRERLRTFARSIGLTEKEFLSEDVEGVPIGSLQPGRLLCVQIAKNKKTDEKDVEAVKKDYVYCVNRLAPYADVLVVNVSSPNTPGLRDLQATGPLTALLGAVVEEAQRTPGRKNKPRVMVKVSPDENDDTQMEGVVQAVWESGVDGIIVGNTTKRRAGLVPQGIKLTGKEQKNIMEEGGYSGPQLFDQTLNLVGRYRKMLDSYPLRTEGLENVFPRQKVLFATGGITNGEQALQVLNAGASVAMIYTGMVYGGSGTVTRIKKEMRDRLAIEEEKA